MKCSIKRHWGWVMTSATFLHFFANYGFLYSYGQLLVIFQDEFDKGATLTGWLGTIPFGLTYLGSPLSNALISRYQHRPVAVIGTIFCFVSLVMTSFMTSVLSMFFTFSLLYGLGINFVTVSALNVILKHFPERQSARPVTIALIGCNTGLLAVNPLMCYLNNCLGWRNSLRIASAAILATGIGAASTYVTHNSPEPERKKEYQIKGNEAQWPMLKPRNRIFNSQLNVEGPGRVNSQGNVHSQRDGRSQDASWSGKGTEDHRVVLEREASSLSVLYCPELWMSAIALVACSAAVSFFYMSLVNFLNSKGFDDKTSAVVMSALGISQVIGKVMVAATADHLPFPKVFALVIAAMLGAVLMGSLLAVKTVIPMFTIISASGLFVISVLDTIPHSLSHQIFSPNLCLVSWTVFTSAMGSGYIVGALLGESIDRTGSYDVALYVCMGLFLSSALLFTMIPGYQMCCAPRRVIEFGPKAMSTDVVNSDDSHPDRETVV